MKALQATCIVGAITFTGIHQVGGNTLGATVPDPMPEAAVSAETPGSSALSAAVPEAYPHHDAAQPAPTTRDASDGGAVILGDTGIGMSVRGEQFWLDKTRGATAPTRSRRRARLRRLSSRRSGSA